MPIPVKRPSLFWLLVLLVPLLAGVANAQQFDPVIRAAPTILRDNGHSAAARSFELWSTRSAMSPYQVLEFAPQHFNFMQARLLDGRTAVAHATLRGAILSNYGRINYQYAPPKIHRNRLHVIMRSKFPAVCQSTDTRTSVVPPAVLLDASGSILSEAVGHLESKAVVDDVPMADDYGIVLNRYPVILYAVNCRTSIASFDVVNGGVIPGMLRHEVSGIFWTIAGQWDVNTGRCMGWYSVPNNLFSSTYASGLDALYSVNMRTWRTATGLGRDYLYLARWEYEPLKETTVLYTEPPTAGNVPARFDRLAILKIGTGAIIDQRSLK